MTTRTNRQTGTRVSVDRAEALGLDDSSPWYAVCEDHGALLSCDTKKLAGAHAAAPAGWCEACAAILEAKCETA